MKPPNYCDNKGRKSYKKIYRFQDQEFINKEGAHGNLRRVNYCNVMKIYVEKY